MSSAFGRRSLRSPFRGLPREVAVLAAVAFAVAVGFGVVAPAIPEFARSFGVGKTAAGAVISAFALMRFVSALGGGKLVDVFGERLILAAGIFIVAVSTGLAGLSQTYVQLLVLRGLGGIGSAMFTISATSLLFRVVDQGNRGRAAGVFQSGFLIGGMLGPLFGGFLTEQSLRLPFYTYAISLLAAGSIGAVFLQSARLRPLTPDVPGPDDPARSATPPTGAGSDQVDAGAEPRTDELRLTDAIRQRPYQAALAVNFVAGFAVFGVRASLIPLFVHDALGEPAKWTGIGFLCSSLAQALMLVASGRIVDTRGRRPAMIVGSTLAAAALLTMGLIETLPVFLISMVALGVAASFLGTAPVAVVGDLMRERSGRVVAAFSMASDLGAITGPVMAGVIADRLSYAAALVACSAVMAVGVITALRMPETLRHPDRVAAEP
jgi:MFS family permease